MGVTMAKRPKKTGETPNEPSINPSSKGSIRIKPDLAYKLRIICEAESTSAAEFLDPLIRLPIEMAFRRISRQLSDLAGPADAPPA